MDRLLMGIREARRLGAIEDAIAGKCTNGEGAARSGLSPRQFRRLKQKVRQEGVSALVHGNRGRPSGRQVAAETRERVEFWLKHPKVKVNDVQVAEKLHELEKIEVSRETVRRIRRQLGLAAKRQRRPRLHRQRRLREGRCGAMVLIDGSPFAWLGEAEPPHCLMGAMDDATGQILSLFLCRHENLHGFAVVLQQVFTRHGLPERVYGDRTGVFVRNDSHWTLEEELAGAQRPTQLRQVLEDLSIDYIAALSPQAKGRIERLWHTLQDRLVVELRLRELSTVEQVLAYLPEFIDDFNTRFAVPAREVEIAWRRAPRELDLILSCRYERAVAKDNTVTLEERVVHIPRGPHRRSYAQCRVELRELLDGRLVVRYQDSTLATQPPPTARFELKPRKLSRRRASKNDAHRSLRIDDRAQVRPPTRGTKTDQRTSTTTPRRQRPADNHRWRRERYSPNSPVLTR